MKEKRNKHPGKPPNLHEAQPRWKDLKVSKKSAVARLRKTGQSESHTNYLHNCPRQHSLRLSGGAWVLRLKLQRSVPGRGLRLVLWRQPEGLRSAVP